MPGNTCQFVTGRLLEMRVVAYRTVDDVDEMIGMLASSLAKLRHTEKVVIAADWRLVHPMSPDTAARARSMLASMNPRVIRSGIWTLPENSTTNLQVVRLIREAENANRRHFTSEATFCSWLSEVLNPDEAERLRVFCSPLIR